MTDPEDLARFSNHNVGANVRSELAREMSREEIAAAQGEVRLFLTRH